MSSELALLSLLRNETVGPLTEDIRLGTLHACSCKLKSHAWEFLLKCL